MTFKNTDKNLWTLIKRKPQKIGYFYLTKNGSLCLRTENLMDSRLLGEALKKGVFVKPNDLDNPDDYQISSVSAYIDNKPQKIGYTSQSVDGNILIKANSVMNSKKLGELLKKGLYVQRKKQKSEYKSAADQYEI